MERVSRIRCATRSAELFNFSQRAPFCTPSDSLEFNRGRAPKIRNSSGLEPDNGVHTDSFCKNSRNVDGFQSCVSIGSVLEKIVSRASGKGPPLSMYSVPAESNTSSVWQYVLDGKVSFEPKLNTSLGDWLTYVELLAPTSKTKSSELAVKKIVQILNGKQDARLGNIKIKLSVPDIIQILTTLDTPTSAFVFYKWVRKQSYYICDKSIFTAVIERLITPTNLDTWDQLNVVIEDMLRKKTVIDNNQFGRLLALACKGGSKQPCSTRMQQYVEWLLKMRQVGFVPWFSTYEKAMKKCNKLEMYESTLSIFKVIPMNTYFWAFALALSACRGMNNLDLAESIFQKMKLLNLKPDAKCFNILLALYADHGRADKAEKLFEEMKELQVLMDFRAYTSVIHAYGKSGWVKQAEDIFRSIEGKLDPGIYRAMAACYRDAGYFNELLALLRETNGSLVGATCFASAFEACVEKSQWKFAIEILKDMQACGMSPTSRLYPMILLACSKVNDYRACEDLEFDVRKMDVLSLEELERIVIMYLSMERASSALDALRLLNERQFGPPTAGFYEQCIRLFLKASLPDAMEMYHIMRSAGHLPSSSVFTMLIQEHIDTNDMLQSKKLHDDMVLAGMQPEEHIATSMKRIHEEFK
eukprot:c20756_g6_i1 orf=46-1971(+)